MKNSVIAKVAVIAWVAVTALCAGCDQPIQPPAPKTDQPYTGVYQDQVNALEKAKQAGSALENAEAERLKQTEQATQ